MRHLLRSVSCCGCRGQTCTAARNRQRTPEQVRTTPLPPASDPRALPVERLMLGGIEIAGVESLHMRQQRLGEVAPFHLIIAQGVLQFVMQRLQGVVAIDPREAAIVVDHLAVAHDGAHALGLGALNDRVKHRHLLVEIGIGNLPPVDQREVGGLALRDRPDLLAKSGGSGTADGRHPQHLRHGRHLVADARHAVGAQHQPHFLQHVTVVIDAGFIKADRGVDSLGLEVIERRDAGAQPEIGGTVVTHACAGLRHAVDVCLAEPDAVAERQMRPEHIEAVDVLHRCAFAAPPGIFLLHRGLEQMHVHRHFVFPRGLRQRGQGLVGAPVQVRGRELDLHPGLGIVAGVHRFEHAHRVIETELEPPEPALHRVLQLPGQARDECLVGLIDEPVLVAHRVAVRHPHADILVGADDLVGLGFHLAGRARHPAVDVLHGGDAGSDHLERRIERVEVDIEIARHHAGDEPQFQRHVR